MANTRELGEFLRTRRAGLRPEDVGLASYGDRRRVPGLRREELARLAGVSESYYSRLEQGQSAHASAEVLDAIAGALRLDDTEQAHLRALASGSRGTARRGHVPETAGPAVRQLVAAMGDTPVVVLGRASDVLLWNATGHALFAGHVEAGDSGRPGRRPNLTRLVFLDGHTRELYADWTAKARAVVGTLRISCAQNPEDAALSYLVGELTVKSPEFVAMWADHRLKAGGAATYEMRHPTVGTLHVTQQTLRTEEGQQVVLATTEAGSPSQTALTLLAHSLTGTTPARPVRTGNV